MQTSQPEAAADVDSCVLELEQQLKTRLAAEEQLREELMNNQELLVEAAHSYSDEKHQKEQLASQLIICQQTIMQQVRPHLPVNRLAAG